MTTTKLTRPQAAMLETIRTTRVEVRRDRYTETEYWTVNDARQSGATTRVMDRLIDMGLVATRRDLVRVNGMNTPRKARTAYLTEAARA